MQIAPRYDGPPIVTLADDAADGSGGGGVGEACTRQRHRLRGLLAALPDDDWRTPSRCEGWTVQDVAAHLDGVNRFWRTSIVAGLAGSPTRMLAGFDPKATPAAMVEAARSATSAEMLAALAESSEALCEVVDGLSGDQWSMIADAPAGHIPIRLLVHHALWDSWVHERDIALPLGLPTTEEPDEVMASLRFVAALGPAIALISGTATPATLALETTDPDGYVLIEVTDHITVHGGPTPNANATVVVRDTAVHLIEALSARAPLTCPVPTDHRWLIDTLSQVFESGGHEDALS